MSLYEELGLGSSDAAFRLLDIHDASVDEPLRASMTVEELSSTVDYEALSYCWGDRPASEPLYVNDHVHYITGDLQDALLQLREDQRGRKSPIRLWVDAVCINQADMSEKSSQVKMMQDVFATARAVRAWLGTTHLADLALTTIQRFGSEGNALSEHQEVCRELSREQDIIKTDVWQLLTLPYFQRTWIVQEIVVAKQVYVQLRSTKLDFAILAKGLRRMTGCGFYPFTPFVASVTCLDDWREWHQRSDLQPASEYGIRILIDSQDRKVLDFRDKLFAMRGIVSNSLSDGIVVDYKQSIRTVYVQFAHHVLVNRGDLLLLSAVVLEHAGQSSLVLPSYVPDWSLPKAQWGILQRFYRFDRSKFFKASGDKPSTVGLQGGGIGIRGLQLDEVHSIIDIKSLVARRYLMVDAERMERGLLTEIMNLVLQEMPTDLDLPSACSGHGEILYKSTGEQLWQAIMRTLTADRSLLSNRVSDEYRASYFSVPLDNYQQYDVLSSHVPHRVVSLLIPTLIDVMMDKVIFVTKKGYIGIAQRGICIGALLCLFYGGQVLYLLKDNPSSSAFTFLCEAYAHGLMDGQGLELETNQPDRNFYLV